MGAYLLAQTQAALEAKAQESLIRHLYTRAGEVTEWMKNRLDEPSRWSTSFIAYDALEARADGRPSAARLGGELQAYLDDVHSRYEQLYESLFVVDLDGQVVVGSRNEVLEDWAIASLPRKPSGAEAAHGDDEGKRGVLTPMRASDRLGRPTLLALHRIERTGRVVGYFVARIDTQDLERLLARPAADGAAHFLLLDRDQAILIASGEGGPRVGEKFAPRRTTSHFRRAGAGGSAAGPGRHHLRVAPAARPAVRRHPGGDGAERGRLPSAGRGAPPRAAGRNSRGVRHLPAGIRAGPRDAEADPPALRGRAARQRG